MQNKPKRSNGPIDFNAISEGQRTQIERVMQTGGKIAVAQQREYKQILDAVRDEFDSMVGTIEDERFLRQIFAAYGRSAKAVNARRIARHPMCPSEVREEIAERMNTEQAARDAKSAGEGKVAGRGVTPTEAGTKAG